MPIPLPEPNLCHALAIAQCGAGCATVIDIGARALPGETDGHKTYTQGYWRLPHVAKLHGFEPDAEECARLNAAARPGERYYPIALGANKRTATLHVTKDPGSSSVYPPDPHYRNTYPDLHIHDVVKTVPVDLVPLREWAEQHGVTEAHAIKADTQGSEWDCFAGAGDLLSTTIMVACEVEFAQMYEQQMTLDDVQDILASDGLYLYRFDKLVHYPRCTGRYPSQMQVVVAPEHIPVTMSFGRLLWADALFLREPESLPLPTDDDSLRQSLIALCLYQDCGQRDLALVMLNRLLSAPRDLWDDFAYPMLASVRGALGF